MTLLAVGSVGWGDITLRAGDRLARRAPQLRPIIVEEFGLPMQAAIGIALFLAVGGIAVAAELAYLPLLYGWFVVGTVAAVGLRARRGHFRFTLGRRPLARTALLVAVSLAVAWVAYGPAVDGPYNANDDDAAYLYLAQRLISTGGMIDPFNMRRISSYGGAELFQALVLGTAGNSAGLAVEWFFFALLCVALVVRHARRPGAVLAVAIIGLVLVLGRPVGIWANVAPTFSGVALTIALLQLLAVARRDGDARLYGLGGLFLAGLLSLRLEFALPAGVALMLSALTEPGVRRRLGALRAAAACGVVGIAGWAVALQASSQTPLFPLFSGTWNTSFPWRNPAISSATSLLEFLRGELATDRFGAELAASVAVALALIMLTRRLGVADRPRAGALVLCFAVVGCLLEVVVETKALSGGTFADIGRYDAPNGLACVLVALDLIWQTTTRAPALPQADMATIARKSPNAFAFGAGTAIVLLFATVGEPLGVYRAALVHDVRSANATLRGSSGFGDRWAYLRGYYDEVNQLIPRHAKLLAAVDQPALLNASRFDFATLDVVGAASPAPHIPILAGGLAVVAYLRRLGYTGVVASVTEATGLYSYKSWEKNETSGIPDYRVEARYFLAWGRDLSGISHHPGITAHHVGTLLLLTW
jgi:hypothetical protein